MGYDAIIFDNDGVLTEMPSRGTLARAARSTFRSVGLGAPDRSDVRDLVTGNLDGLRATCRERGVDVADLCRRAREYSYREQTREIRAGVRRLYDDAEAIGALDRPLGVVSDNQRRVVEFVLSYFDLEEHFDAVYGCSYTPEDLRRMKPDPHYIVRTMEDLGADSALYVGDRAVDVAAADRAGIDSALVERDHADVDAEPTYRIDGLTDLTELIASA